jgi:hypothetical protein
VDLEDWRSLLGGLREKRFTSRVMCAWSTYSASTVSAAAQKGAKTITVQGTGLRRLIGGDAVKTLNQTLQISEKWLNPI